MRSLSLLVAEALAQHCCHVQIEPILTQSSIEALATAQAIEHVLDTAGVTSPRLLLFRDQRFRGYCILSFAARNATRLEDLSDLEYQAFCEDLRSSSRAIRAAMQPDHMNYELLGNSHPQLHWHIIPRYRSDPRWGRPIWEEWSRNEFKVNRVRLGDEEYQAIIQQIRKQLLAAP